MSDWLFVVGYAVVAYVVARWFARTIERADPDLATDGLAVFMCVWVGVLWPVAFPAAWSVWSGPHSGLLRVVKKALGAKK